jgi:ADP-ribose pyrophosphatase YjhB (NUDIX family)
VILPDDRGWLSEQDWKAVQKAVPIACADVLPIREGRDGVEAGLICRDTPQQGKRWVTVGGRVLLDEKVRDAVLRQVHETLGPGVKCKVAHYPIAIVEYVSRRANGKPFDPRQHAIGLTYVVRLSGSVQAGGEAFEFGWFTRRTLPPAREIGFGQRPMLLECFDRLEQNCIEGWRP